MNTALKVTLFGLGGLTVAFFGYRYYKRNIYYPHLETAGKGEREGTIKLESKGNMRVTVVDYKQIGAEYGGSYTGGMDLSIKVLPNNKVKFLLTKIKNGSTVKDVTIDFSNGIAPYRIF